MKQMKLKFIRISLALSLPALIAAGCTAHPMLFEFNGRLIEVHEMQNASLPRGLEVTYFDGQIMKINGREAIKVNGKDLTVSESKVNHGGNRHTLGPEHKLVIQKDGNVSIVELKKDNAKKGWWVFWR